MTSFDACVLSSPNPFHDLVAPDAPPPAAGSVAMFDEVLEGWGACVAAMEQSPPEGRSVVLAAASGVGKTHLLLRFQAASSGRIAFARIFPWAAADDFYPSLLAHMVGDWARPAADGSEGPLFVLAARCGDVDARKDPLRRALGLLTTAEGRTVALRWLSRQSVADEILSAWELPVIEAPMAARRLTFDLLRLMAPVLPVVLAFDQLDSAPRRADGAADLTPLLAFDAELRAQPALSARCLLILSLLEDNWRRLKDDPAHRQAVGRLDKRKGKSFLIKGSTAEQCRAVARLRLAPIHAKSDPDEAPDDPLYPLDPAAMTDAAILGAKGLAPIRDFLRHAAALYHAFKNTILLGGSDEVPPPPPPTDPLEVLRRHWLEQRAAAAQYVLAEKVHDAESLRGLALAWAGLVGGPPPSDEPALPSPDGAYGRNAPDGRLAVWYEGGGNLQFFHFITRLTAQAHRPILFLRAAGLPKKGLKSRSLFDAFFSNEPHRYEHPSTALKVMALTVRRLEVMHWTGDLGPELQGLSLREMLAMLAATEAYQPLRSLLGIESLPAKVAGPTPAPIGGGEPIEEEDIPDVIQEFLQRERLVGWAHVRARVLSLLPTAKPALLVRVVEQLVRERKVRWVNPNVALELRMLALPLAPAA